MTRTLVALGLCLAGCVCLAAPRAQVRLWGSVDGGTPKPGWVHARADQRVVLHVHLTPQTARVRDVEWFALEPTSQALDNTTPSFHFENVRYGKRELSSCRGQLQCAADVSPEWMPKVPGLSGLGAMAYQVRVTLQGGQVLQSPGEESVERGGLSREVFKVAIRKDDTYLGYLTELLNTPYIFGSDGKEGSHQADLLIGSDCADLAVYAARRSGKDAKYVSTYSIDEQAPEVRRAVSTSTDSAAFVDARGGVIRVGAGRGEVRPGDLVLFPSSRHVGVLWEDRAPKGVLDGNDLMFHTCWAPPTVEAIGASRCASFPVRVLRFR